MDNGLSRQALDAIQDRSLLLNALNQVRMSQKKVFAYTDASQTDAARRLFRGQARVLKATEELLEGAILEAEKRINNG